MHVCMTTAYPAAVCVSPNHALYPMQLTVRLDQHLSLLIHKQTHALLFLAVPLAAWQHNPTPCTALTVITPSCTPCALLPTASHASLAGTHCPLLLLRCAQRRSPSLMLCLFFAGVRSAS